MHLLLSGRARTARALPIIAISLLAAAGCGSIKPVEPGHDAGADGGAGGGDAAAADGTASDRQSGDGPSADAAPLVCPPGFADCDGDPLTGSEPDLPKPAHCGSCAPSWD